MATLSVQEAPVSGLAAVVWTAAAAGGDEAPTGRDLVLLVNNTDTASHTLTVVTPGTVDGIGLEDVTVGVAAGDVAVVPLREVYRDSSTRRAALSLDAETGVEYALVRLPW
ncbi:hypothetical protein [Nocardiopsis suaedae]|uniref:Uncharacterized protein n=1 Tax=Nocardiopsis suaedae TaxID=3018444 RepID=A0ABT4TLX4_9ACTN|nr:hypothetical protein [Nocardiopsis suaedae]MDA2805706.1 hypothetical protein [Nocardiopsis suaedae]